MDEKVRGAGKVVVWLFLLMFVATLTASAIMALLNLTAAVLLGAAGEILPNLLVLAGVAAVFIFLGWLYINARKESEKGRSKEPLEPRPDGDMSDVAGIPPRDPWLG